MIKVIIPVVVLLFVILCKKLPRIGGNIYVALMSAGVCHCFSAVCLRRVSGLAHGSTDWTVLDGSSVCLCLEVFMRKRRCVLARWIP